MAEEDDEHRLQASDRTTLCLADPMTETAIHRGDSGFRKTLRQHYSSAESNAVETLVRLKRRLGKASSSDFWAILAEGMTKVTSSQCGFVSKSVKKDEIEDIEVPFTDVQEHVMHVVVLYRKNGERHQNIIQDIKYGTVHAPCSVMKYEKVFLVPKGLQDLFPRIPSLFPSSADAYLGIPLSVKGRRLGHFGVLWHEEGLHDLPLSWAHVESLLHSLEDVVTHRILHDEHFHDFESAQTFISTSDVTNVSQSLKPFARNLSHELRTPMQGVVGMLDVMHASVQEFLEGRNDSGIRRMLHMMRDNIEAVQDSSRRAVDAADNVVHAYDLDMQVPDTPVEQNDEPTIAENEPVDTARAEKLGTISRGTKRQRISDSSDTGALISQLMADKGEKLASDASTLRPTASSVTMDVSEPGSATSPGFHQARLRESLRLIIDESLRVGGRPESAFAQEIEGGERMEVISKGADGHLLTKVVDWTVDPNVPDTILMDEKDFAKLISCVFLNAVKFTEQGTIKLNASLSPKARFIVIRVTDTGPGIPDDFLPYLFKPFSREDHSLTRQKEGLGLGLLVAKGLARKIGGDLVCIRSDVVGPNRGSEFELRIPSMLGEFASNSPTPLGTPTHGHSASNKPSQRSIPMDQVRDTWSTPSALKSASLQHQPFETPNVFEGDADDSIFSSRRPSLKEASAFDRRLAAKYPLTFLVAEDNSLNRRLLVSMLNKLGYNHVFEAQDGEEAVNQVLADRSVDGDQAIDVILMDLWMPKMDGYEAARRILAIEGERRGARDSSRAKHSGPRHDIIILAVTADVTDRALSKATSIGMSGYMTKPYRLLDLERTILEYCITSDD